MFLNVVMLAGIAGAAVPLLLHLLSRARCRQVNWGAMMFLHTADARQRRSTRLKQWLLLAVRMALVSLLAIALARPVAAGRLGSFGQQGALTTVILLDRSASMSIGRAGHTRRDEAEADVLQILSTLHHGDEAAIITLGDTPQSSFEPTTDLQSLIDSLRTPDFQTTGWGVANISDGLSRAADILSHSTNSNRRLYLVCDRQALNWEGLSADFTAAWRKRLTESAAPTAQFFVIPVGGWETGGLAIESINVQSPQIIADQPAEIETSVENYGAAPVSNIALALYVGETKAVATTLNIAAHGSTSVRQTIHIHSAGSHVVTAKIESAGGSVNQLSRAVDVVVPIKVLIIRLPAAGPPSVDYLKLALTPFASNASSIADMAAVRTLDYSPSDDWSTLAAEKNRVIVLDNIPQLTPAQVRVLEQHVYGGGGLLVSPGPLSQIENLNAGLYRDGSGILPAALGRSTALASAGITGIDRTHPIFHFLDGQPDPDPATAVGRYFPTLTIQPDAQVLATVANSPLVIAARFGFGRVVLTTTPINQDWNTLPRTNLYLPMVQSMVRFLAAGAPRNLEPRQAIIAQFDDLPADAARSAEIHLPSHGTRTVPLQPVGESFQARFNDTAEPGVYTATAGDRTLHFVVTSDCEEADLTPLTQQQWQTYSSELGFQIVDASQTPISAAVRDERSPRELWAFLLMLVMLLALAEVLIEGTFSEPLHSSEPELAA